MKRLGRQDRDRPGASILANFGQKLPLFANFTSRLPIGGFALLLS
jgi:hypothetical protein